MKRAAWGAALSVALLLGACSDEPEAPPTYLVPRDYPTPQAAIDAAEEGGTVLIAPGTYTANSRQFPRGDGFPDGAVTAMLIQKNINVIGNGDDGSIVFQNVGHPDSLIYGAMLVNTGTSSIQNLAFENFSTGIAVMNSSGRVLGCEAVGGDTGIWCSGANDALIQLNYVAGCTGDGILVEDGDPVVEANLITQCARGLGVTESARTPVWGNIVCFNTVGIGALDGAEPTLVLNAILHNSESGVITGAGARPEMRYTDILDNPLAVRVLQYTPPLEAPLDFEENHWGEDLDENDVLALIEDARVDTTLGATIDISPIDPVPYNLGQYNPNGIDLVDYCLDNQTDLRSRWRDLLFP